MDSNGSKELNKIVDGIAAVLKKDKKIAIKRIYLPENECTVLFRTRIPKSNKTPTDAAKKQKGSKGDVKKQDNGPPRSVLKNPPKSPIQPPKSDKNAKPIVAPNSVAAIIEHWASIADKLDCHQLVVSIPRDPDVSTRIRTESCEKILVEILGELAKRKKTVHLLVKNGDGLSGSIEWLRRLIQSVRKVKAEKKEASDGIDGSKKEKQGEEKQGEEKQGEEKQGEEKQGEEKQGEEKQGEEKQGEEKQGEEKQGKEKQGKDNKEGGLQKPDPGAGQHDQEKDRKKEKQEDGAKEGEVDKSKKSDGASSNDKAQHAKKPSHPSKKQEKTEKPKRGSIQKESTNDENGKTKQSPRIGILLDLAELEYDPRIAFNQLKIDEKNEDGVQPFVYGILFSVHDISQDAKTKQFKTKFDHSKYLTHDNLQKVRFEGEVGIRFTGHESGLVWKLAMVRDLTKTLIAPKEKKQKQNRDDVSDGIEGSDSNSHKEGK